MGFTTNTSSSVSELNSNNSIICPGFNAYSGNVVSCTSTTITLDSSANPTNDYYNNLMIEIISGSGYGTFRKITDYDGSTKTLTVSKLGEMPTSESMYVIHKYSGILESQSQSGKRINVKFPSHMSSIDNFYLKQMVRIIHIDYSTETRFIEDYNGTTKIATVKNTWDSAIISGDYFIISGESGIASSGSGTTITLDGNQSSSVIPDLVIEITSGTGNDQIRKIASISGNVVTTYTAWTTSPDSTSSYRIFSGWMGEFESTENISQISYISSVEKYEKVLCCTAVSNTSSKTKAVYTVKESYNSEVINHNFNAKGKYFRIYIMSIGTTISGYITTNKDFTVGADTKTINQTLTSTDDSSITRSVITGKCSDNGKFKNIQTDTYGNLNVNIMQPTDIFNNVSVAEPRVLIELKFPYSTSHYAQDYFMKGTGILYNSGNSVLNAFTAIPYTTPTSESVARLKSVHRSIYSAGLSLKITFSAFFSDPAVGCRQIIGHGDQNNGLFFGYNGLEFGIMRRYGGKSEIRSLLITSGATSTGNVVVELNGISTNIPVISGDSIYTVAEKIANGVKVAPYYLQTEYAYMNPGWLSYLEKSDKVQFYSEDSGPYTGNYSITGQGVAGTFTRTQTGVVSTDEWTYVYDWVYDRIDGTSSLPIMNFNNGNIFEIDIQWLGFGNIAFKIQNPITGRMVTAHIIRYPNNYTSPSLHVPHQPLMLEAYNGSTTSFVSVSTACMTSHTLGQYNMYNASRFGTSEIKQRCLSKDRKYNILTLRNSPTFVNTTNIISQLGLSIASSWKAASAAIFRVLVNANLEIPYVLAINSAGTDYVAGEIQAATGGSGSGMKLKITSVGGSGELTGVSISVPGYGYKEQDTVTLEGGTGGTIDINHIALTWTDRKTSVSTANISTDYVEVTGGEEQFSIAMGSNTSFFETFNDMEIYMPPMYSITLAIQPVTDEIDAEFSSSFFWSEKQ